MKTTDFLLTIVLYEVFFILALAIVIISKLIAELCLFSGVALFLTFAIGLIAFWFMAYREEKTEVAENRKP